MDSPRCYLSTMVCSYGRTLLPQESSLAFILEIVWEGD